MSKHEAKAAMLGYLYQVRYSLLLLLESLDPQTRVTLEWLDDIVLDAGDGTPMELLQMKHHVRAQGDVSDSSPDIWRTLAIWIDLIGTDHTILENAKFSLITTSSAQECSAAWFLGTHDNRDPSKAFELLQHAAQNSTNRANAVFYAKFEETPVSDVQRLLSSVYVIDNEHNIVDTETALRKQIRYSCRPQHEDDVLERIEGWWFKVAIGLLLTDRPVFVSQTQARTRIFEVSDQYKDDNLPIDDFFDIDESKVGCESRMFYHQLKLLELGSERLRVAIRDYYRATEQRSIWLSKDLLYANELDNYESRLIDEWDHAFARMKDDLEDYGETITEAEKTKGGRRLYSEMEEKDIRIRDRCLDSFIMRGSYHMLADGLKVGWHVDFVDRLRTLLEERE